MDSSYVKFFLALFGSVVLYNYPAEDPHERVRNVPTAEILPEYDFIIVGAGSAGSVLANRLTEVPSWNVLLIEAGGDEDQLSDTPLMAPYLWNTSLNWGYYTQPQARACRANYGRCVWPRGRVLGGSSTLNFMVYVRGNRRDYDNWAQMGNPGWSYDEVLPYFKLSEDATFPNADPNYHGFGGYLTVSQPTFRTPLGEAYIAAGAELGYQYLDFNARNQTGFMYVPGTLRNGSRCSTGKAFLRPARNRPNLHVIQHALVTRVLFNGTTAVGVEFQRNSTTLRVAARNEVIMSAGSINTAQILMLSGVGPSDELNRLGIPILKELPVGMNLHDHYGVPISYKTNSTGVTWDELEDPNTLLEYSRPVGRGPLTLPGGIEVVSFHNASFTDQSEDFPEIEIHWDTFNPVLSVGNNTYWTALNQVLHSQSRGRITLNSTDPTDPPIMDPNYFQSDRDLRVAVEGALFVYRLSKTPALQKFNSTLIPENYPACLNVTWFTTEYFTCLAQSYTMTIFHPIGTAKMGPESDPEAVVSPRLQVHGISKLRVIDASIMPVIPTGNTNAPTIMIAERGADIIKADYGQPTHISA